MLSEAVKKSCNILLYSSQYLAVQQLMALFLPLTKNNSNIDLFHWKHTYQKKNCFLNTAIVAFHIQIFQNLSCIFRKVLMPVRLVLFEMFS